MYLRCLLLLLLCGVALCNPFESTSNDVVSRMRRTSQPSIKDYCYTNYRKYHDLLDVYGIWAIISVRGEHIAHFIHSKNVKLAKRRQYLPLETPFFNMKFDLLLTELQFAFFLH